VAAGASAGLPDLDRIGAPRVPPMHAPARASPAPIPTRERAGGVPQRMSTSIGPPEVCARTAEVCSSPCWTEANTIVAW